MTRRPTWRSLTWRSLTWRSNLRSLVCCSPDADQADTPVTVHRTVTGRALRAMASGLAVVCACGVLAAAPASAEPSPLQLRRQAAELRAQLDKLELQEDLAVERYAEAQQAVQDATVDEVLARQQLTDLQVGARSTADRGASRVRAIYQSGGPLGLTSTLLESASLEEVAARWHIVQSLVRGDTEAVDTQLATVRWQRRLTSGAALTRAQVVARQEAAGRAAITVRDTVERRQALLASVDATVLRVAEQERRAEQERALREAADRARQLGIGGMGEQLSAGAEALAGRTDAQGRGLEGATARDQRLPAVAAPNGIAAAAIQAAATRLGMPYVWGATGPSSFDCSGLMMWSYAQAGLAIPRNSRAQYAGLPHIPLSALAPGDLVFYASDTNNPATIHHVGMYVGAGLSLYAPRTGSVVKIGPVGYGTIIGAARPSLL
ncbi:MAG: NlpC/P60 family protein [Angustibacter sp.]